MFWRKQKERADKNSVRQSALDEIARTWNVDASDVTLTEDGFDWLPGSHLVRVRIHQDERKSDGPVRFRITITTDYLRSVPVHDKEFVQQANEVSHLFCPTYSLVYPPRELVAKYLDGYPIDATLFASAYVYDDTVKWLSGFLARMSVMQPISAEILSRGSGLFVSGTPALAGTSLRETVNGVLNIHVDLLIPEGDKPSRWIGSDEFEAFIAQYGRSDLCFGFGDENGMTFETPFGTDSALVTFKTSKRDLHLGAGLVVQSQIRTELDLNKACETAALLNHLESVVWTDFPQLGRWHTLAVTEPQTGDVPEEFNLAHTCFIPNAYFVDGLVVNYALWAIARLRWTREKLIRGEEDLTMPEILEQRRRS